MIGAMSAGQPAMWTGTIIRVRGVILRATSAGSMLIVCGSTSASTTLAPIDSG